MLAHKHCGDMATTAPGDKEDQLYDSDSSFETFIPLMRITPVQHVSQAWSVLGGNAHEGNEDSTSENY